MKLNLHPKGDYLLLQAMQETEVSKGGILIPDQFRRILNQGIVIERGPDVLENTFFLDEIVVFPLHTEYRIDNDDTLFFLVRAGDIMAGDEKEMALSEGGVEDLKLNKKRPALKMDIAQPPLQEKRRPIGLHPEGPTEG